jgi:glycosyltransferase involved in cell wall biosynthesis
LTHRAMSPSISFLICTHRAPASLDLLFDSFRLQKWQPGDEIILVDNGVEAKRAAVVEERLAELAALGVHTLYSKEPKTGLTHARLKGFSLVAADWLVLLDDDNSLHASSLIQIRDRISANPQLGGICCRVEPIWENPPPSWVLLLGHEVLSYNTSSVRSIPYLYKEWEGGKKGLRPPGGGMIIHRSAADAFVELSRTFSFLTQLGHRGAALGSGEDYMIYNQVYRLKRPTAYDGSIVIRHRIPEDRTHFDYLCRLLFRANYGFGLVALAILGKAFFLPSIGHSVIRLSTRLITAGRFALSFRVLIAFGFAFAGYVSGTLSGLFRSDLTFFKKQEL